LTEDVFIFMKRFIGWRMKLVIVTLLVIACVFLHNTDAGECIYCSIL